MMFQYDSSVVQNPWTVPFRSLRDKRANVIFTGRTVPFWRSLNFFYGFILGRQVKIDYWAEGLSHCG